MLEVAVALALCAAPEVIGFQQAVERAVAQNPAMRVAEQDAVRARALVEQARAFSLPTLGAAGTYTRLDADRTLQERIIAGKDQLSGTVTLAVPLISPPRWAQWYRAAKSADAAHAGADDFRRQVALLAARSWLGVLAQKRVLDAAVRARDTARGHLDYARDRRVGGVGNRLDEIRAAQELAVSEGAVENGLGQLARLQEALGVVVGVEGPLDVPTEEPDLGTPSSVGDALQGAEGVRLDVKAARVRDDAASAATALDFTDYLPLLTATFQPFYQNPPSLVQPLTGWQAQVVLTIPLYDGGLRYGQQRERRALQRQSSALLEASLRQAKSEVRATFEAVKHADLALRAARDAEKQAALALELANLAYRTGVTTNLEVLDAERRARDAQTQTALAEDGARQARLDLLAASGRFP